MSDAQGALNIFGCAVEHRRTNPAKGNEDAVIDLTLKENRDAIRQKLVHIIHQYGLEGCNETEIGAVRLIPLVKDKSKSPITDAALRGALAINSINFIARTYYEDFPHYRPLYEMMDNLAKTCCAGAAQTIGADLPPDIIRTWPYFSKIFAEAKTANTWLWPDV